ncbi:hypothetical protein PMAYCL1PPCAC_05255, partial [Pristionchus mayeri]
YRLVGLEKHAGYRCFSKIEFNAGNGMDGEVAKKMNVTFKTLHFRKITFSSYNVHSENLLSELLNGDRDVNDVNIEWNNDFSIDNI